MYCESREKPMSRLVFAKYSFALFPTFCTFFLLSAHLLVATKIPYIRIYFICLLQQKIFQN